RRGSSYFMVPWRSHLAGGMRNMAPAAPRWGAGPMVRLWAESACAMTWTLVSAATGAHIELLEISRASKEAYAARWDMECCIDTDFMGTSDRPASWMKIPLITNTLSDEGCDGVLWVDADALFARNDVDIRREVTAPWNWVVNRYPQNLA